MKINLNNIGLGLVVMLACSAVLPSLAHKKKTKLATPAVVEDTLPANDRKRFDYFFLEAARQQAAGKYAEAFDLLDHAAKINPKAAEVYYYQSMYYSQIKKDSLALCSLQKAIALNPENQTYAERLAQYYIENQQYDKAIDSYEKLYANNHENSDALHILLQLYQQQKNYRMMLNTISRIETAEGESEQITLTKMRIYEMMDDQKAAYNELKSLTEEHPLDMMYKTMLGNWLVQHNRQKEAYKMFMEVLKEEPDDAYAQSSLYDYYNATNQSELARQMLDKILMGKNTDSQTKILMLRSFIQDNESKGGDSVQVLNLLDKVLAVSHPSADVAELRAAYMSLKKMPMDSVNAAFQKVLDIAPDNASARLQLVQNLWNEQKYDEVIAMTEQAQEYNPEEMVFYYFGGMAHYQKHEDEATLNTFRKGVAQVNAKSSPNLVSDLYMIMGDILFKKKDNTEAYAAYDSCLQWKDDNYMGLNNYAYYLSIEGKDLHKAEQMSYKTIKAEPNNGTYLDTYAWILFMEERYAEAKTYIDQAVNNLDTLQDNSTVLEHAGDIYSMNGLVDEAMKYWKKSYEAGNKTGVLERKMQLKQYVTDEETKKKTSQTKAPERKKKIITRKNGKKK